MKKINTMVVMSAVFITIFVWFIVFSTPDNNLHIITCDVGQGDGILITYQSTQIVVDGGPDSKILNCLAENIPFWDRTIELVVMTHPQADHYMGLIDVFKSYTVKSFLYSELNSSSKSLEVLRKLVGSSGVEGIVATTGTMLRVGKMHLDIVMPTSEILTSLKDEPSRDPNDVSVVFELQYGQFKALFTGDMGPETTDDILETGLLEDIVYLKVPHHGSKNGLTQELLEAIDPEVASISVGKKNRYGHPNKEVLDLLSGAGAEIHRTDIEGAIELETDGETWWIDK